MLRPQGEVEAERHEARQPPRVRPRRQVTEMTLRDLGTLTHVDVSEIKGFVEIVLQTSTIYNGSVIGHLASFNITPPDSPGHGVLVVDAAHVGRVAVDVPGELRRGARDRQQAVRGDLVPQRVLGAHAIDLRSGVRQV